MKKELFEDFLLKSTIPPKNKSHENNDYDDILMDIIWRAHRDVLTGRYHLKNYCAQNYIKDKHKENHVVDYLYKKIKDCNSSLNSKVLIDSLAKQFKNANVEFGAIQKLVNMTLKYIITFKAYKTFPFEVDRLSCDCPVDSNILKELEGTYTPWTRLGKDEYKVIQEKIKTWLEANGHKDCGNIVFDLITW